MAIQAVSHDSDPEFIAGDARESAGEKEKSGTDGAVIEPDDDDEDEDQHLISFAIYLYDPMHSLSFSTLSQPFPQRWAQWLDAYSPPVSSPISPNDDKDESGLPESIQEIIRSGGVDPREWVAEWMEEVLSLAVGVVAQRYVARRMGVGEGGLGKGKKAAAPGEEDMSGEAARVI